MKALIVDDSRAVRAILRKILGQLGFEVIEAEHGRQALEQLEQDCRADVALFDWNMPEMDGMQLLRAVRERHNAEELPVMMVTSENELERVVEALDAGANEYVTKPFTALTIVEKLGLLGLKRV